jgi:toxin ParE1/3/4
MEFDVLLTEGAQQDLASICDYIAEFDSPANAQKVLDGFQKTVDNLSRFPQRGSHPKELQSIGIKEYRQALFKPYRLIYRIIDKRVIIYLITDGRRDMQSLLMHRLLNR